MHLNFITLTWEYYREQPLDQLEAKVERVDADMKEAKQKRFPRWSKTSNSHSPKLSLASPNRRFLLWFVLTGQLLTAFFEIWKNSVHISLTINHADEMRDCHLNLNEVKERMLLLCSIGPYQCHRTSFDALKVIGSVRPVSS